MFFAKKNNLWLIPGLRNLEISPELQIYFGQLRTQLSLSQGLFRSGDDQLQLDMGSLTGFH